MFKRRAKLLIALILDDSSPVALSISRSLPRLSLVTKVDGMGKLPLITERGVQGSTSSVRTAEHNSSCHCLLSQQACASIPRFSTWSLLSLSDMFLHPFLFLHSTDSLRSSGCRSRIQTLTVRHGAGHTATANASPLASCPSTSGLGLQKDEIQHATRQGVIRGLVSFTCSMVGYSLLLCMLVVLSPSRANSDCLLRLACSNVVGKHGDQIKDFHQAQEFVASLRVENDDKRPDQWCARAEGKAGCLKVVGEKEASSNEAKQSKRKQERAYPVVTPLTESVPPVPLHFAC